MKKAFSVILIITLCISSFCIHIGAEHIANVTAPLLSGDVDCDGDVSILDATLIQRYLAKLCEMDYKHEIIADFDHDNNVSITDATWIQRKLAQMNIPETFGGRIHSDVVVKEFYASYSSGKAVVNLPVQFTAYATASGKSLTYEFYVDGLLAQHRSKNNTFIYTFENSGGHDVMVRAYNDWNIYNEYEIPDYRVVADYSYETPSLKTVRIEGEGSGLANVVAEAIGGTAPYTYRFTIFGFKSYELTGLDDEVITTYKSYVESHDECRWEIGEVDGMTCLYCDFTENNYAEIAMLMLPSTCYYVQVQAKDSAGDLTPIEQLEYLNDLIALT